MASPFVRPVKRPQCAGTNFGKVEDDLIFEYEVKPMLIKTGESKFDFITKDTVVLARKYSRFDRVQECVDDVGIMNIVKKVRETGDTTLLNQRVPEFSNKTTEDIEDRLNDALAAKASYANLDPELTGGKSFNDFTENKLTDAQIEAYINQKVAAKLAAMNTAVEGGKENE